MSKPDAFNPIQPPLQAVRINLFPTFDTLDEAKAYAESKIPLEHKNEVHSVLMAYQNTLLNLIQPEQKDCNAYHIDGLHSPHITGRGQ